MSLESTQDNVLFTTEDTCLTLDNMSGRAYVVISIRGIRVS